MNWTFYRHAGAALFLAALNSLSAQPTEAADLQSFTVADVGCVAPITSTESDALTHEVEATDDSARAYWGEIQLLEELRQLQSISNTRDRAQCVAGILTSGSGEVYSLILVGKNTKAWSYAHTLAQLWQRYHNYSEANDKYGDYSSFPDAIAHALHYKCSPAAPDGSCPWPVPPKVRDAIMHELLAQ
jgi:hypothetical protein